MRECVGAIIVRNESILLGRRSAAREFYPDVWDVFGGHVEPLESHTQALARELEEELGIVPTAWHFLESWSEFVPRHEDRVACHFYVVPKWTGTPSNRELHEHVEIRWFRTEELVQLELAHPEYVRILRTAVLRYCLR